MNFMGKSTGDSASSTSSRRQQHQHQQGGGGGAGGGHSFDEDDEEERQNTTPAGQLFPSSSSSSPSSSHHHHHQQPTFLPPPSYHHNNQRAGWLFDGPGLQGGEPSSRLNDPMMLDYSSLPATPAPDNNDDDQQSAHQAAGGMMMVVEREHMFDKVVTPSDVGKLNRLVIPKQHAERYFPLDSSTNDKGLLLNFEDRNGKPWRFRYSYWNSSQSYVMTKGWSRFVKDKKLDAGDIVSFQRGVGGSAKDRLFIDWRHRPDAPAPHYQLSSNLSFPLPHHQFSFHNRSSAGINIHPWNPLFLQSQPAPRSHSNLMLQSPNSYAPSSYRYGSTGGPYHNIGTGSVVNVNQGGSGSVIYFRSGGGGIPQQQQVDMMQMQQRGGVGIDPPALPAPPPPPPAVVFESVPVVHGKAAAKRLRLFGVNMDCPISDDDDQDFDPTSELSPTTASDGTATNPIPMGHYDNANYHRDHFPPDHHTPPSSSTVPYLQLRPYGGGETQFHQSTMGSSSSTDALIKNTKSSSSRMSLDLDI